MARTDKVRISCDVPEMEASYVVPGTKATVRIPAVQGDKIDAKVTRTSWSLMVQSRTLRAEIDLPNPNAPCYPACTRMGR